MNFNKRIKLSTSLCISLILQACGGGTVTVPEIEQFKGTFGKVQGVWQQDGYGTIIKFDTTTNTYTNFQTTDVSCILKYSDSFQDLEKDLDEFELNQTNNIMTLQFHGNFTQFHYQKLQTLPALCENGGTRASTDPSINFEVLWHTFNEQYAFFVQRDLDWSNEYAVFQPQLSSIASDVELFSLFKDMLTSLKDAHVTLDNGETNIAFGSTSPLIIRMMAEFSQQSNISEFETFVEIERGKVLSIIASYLGGSVKNGANEKLYWGALNENVGYLLVNQMNGYSTQGDFDSEMQALGTALNSAMVELADKQALVIDLRQNGGGMAESAMRIASRFVTTETPVLSVKAQNASGFTSPQILSLYPTGEQPFTGPVVILTSSLTASAAEILILAMQASSQITLIGETTAGIFSNQLIKQLPNGWQVSLSNEVYETLNGEIFEAKGIEANIKLDVFSAHDRKNFKDSAIERALSELSIIGY
jgi:carboxyl-terminal processing protease